MSEKPPQNNIENNQTPKSLEGELSPEVMESVMVKVQDLFLSGYGFTSLRSNDLDMLRSILDKGLLGTYTMSRKSGEQKESSDVVNKWMELSRKKREGVLFGNIIGKDMNSKRNIDMYLPDKIYSGVGGGEFNILYDISKKEEVLPGGLGDEWEEMNDKAKRTKNKQIWGKMETGNISEFKDSDNRIESGFSSGIITYKEASVLLENGILKSSDNLTFKDFIKHLKSQKDRIDKLGIDADSLIDRIETAGNFSEVFGHPYSDNGYVIGRRVAPRRFKGIVWFMPKEESVFKENADLNQRLNDLINTFKKISEEKGKDIYLPVYDEFGNLCWPKKMTYDEVKKFVAERDKDKKEKNKNEKDEK